MRIAFSILASLLFSVKLFSQEGINVNLFNQFDRSLKEFLIPLDIEQSDSLYIFYDRAGAVLNKFVAKDGVYHYSVKREANDTVQRKTIISGKTIIVQEYSFDFFLNFILDKKSLTSAGLYKFNGTMAFVSVPWDGWERVYMDHILGYDSLFLDANVDYLKYGKENAVHSRYRLSFCYTKEKGFFIRNVERIRSRRLSLK